MPPIFAPQYNARVVRLWPRRRVSQPVEAPEEVLEAMREVNQYARTHGGSIELVELTDDGTVKVRLHGACKGCPISAITLKLGIEERLRIRLPSIRKVVQVP